MSDKIDYHSVALEIVKEAGALKWRGLPPWQSAEAARTYVENKEIVAKMPETLQELTILAHEAGHIATTPPNAMPGQPRYEYAASQWAIQALAKRGVEPVLEGPDGMKAALATYVEHYAAHGKRVPRKITDWVKGYL